MSCMLILAALPSRAITYACGSPPSLGTFATIPVHVRLSFLNSLIPPALLSLKEGEFADRIT